MDNKLFYGFLRLSAKIQKFHNRVKLFNLGGYPIYYSCFLIKWHCTLKVII